MKIRVSEISGKSLALLLYYVNEDLESSAVLIHGTAGIEGSKVMLYRRGGMPPFPVPGQLLSGIRKVPASLSDIFGGAEFYVTLTARDLDPPMGESWMPQHMAS